MIRAIYFLTLIAVYGASDPICGGPRLLPAIPRVKWRGKPVYVINDDWVPLIIAAEVALVAHNWFDVLLAVSAWLLWRLPGWRLGHDNAMSAIFVRKNWRCTAWALFRHSWVAPEVLMAARHTSWHTGIMSVASFAIVATVVGMLNWAEASEGNDWNTKAEAIRGVFHGATMAAMLGLLR